MSEADSTFSAEFLNAVGGVLDMSDLARDYSLSTFDQRHTFVLNSRYRMPWDHLLRSGLTRATLGGWEVNGIWRIGSGFPVDIAAGFNNSRNGDTANPDRPDLAPGASNNPKNGTTKGCPGIPAGEKLGTPDRFYDPCAFVLPAAGAFGNLARNTVVGPDFHNVDFTLVKNSPLRENMNLEFRAEFFNILNHAHFGAPANATFNSDRTRVSSAGRISLTATDIRQIQLGMKLTF